MADHATTPTNTPTCPACGAPVESALTDEEQVILYRDVPDDVLEAIGRGPVTT